MKKSFLLCALLTVSLVPPLPADTVVVFNEIMYHPATNEPTLEWVEFYNQMAVDVDISGWSVTGGIDYTFPSNTIVRGGDYLLLALSPATMIALTGSTNVFGPFTGRLSNNGDQLRLRNNSGRIMDEVEYGVDGDWPVAPDGSGVSLAKRDRATASEPAANWAPSAQVGGTPGAANFPDANAIPPDTRLVAIDTTWKYEASGTDLGTAWREPGYNDSSWNARAAFTNRALPGLFNTGIGTNGVVVAPGGNDPHYMLTAGAQGTVGTNAIAILNHPNWLANDATSSWIGVHTPGADNVAAGAYYYQTTFSLAGFIPSTAQLNLVVAVDNTLNDVVINGQSSGLTTSGFAAFNPALILASGFVAGVNTLEFRTVNEGTSANPAGFRAILSGTATGLNTNAPLALGPTTYYFRKAFAFFGDPAHTRLRLNPIVADGAVVHLNGVEVFRQNMPTGAVTYATAAVTNVPSPDYSGLVETSAGSLVAGTNVLAVEVHQAAASPDGPLFGADLISTPIPVPPSPPITIAFNELSSSTNAEFWLEVINYGTNNVLLDGCSVVLDGAANSEYVFPALNLTLAPGGYLALTNTTLGFFPSSGDKLYLFAPSRTKVLDSLVVKKRARGRWPDGTGEWLNPATSTPGAANVFTFHDEIVINEIMYNHSALPATNNLPPQKSHEAWIELFNKSSNTVDLTGWELASGVSYPFTPGQTIGPGGYLVVADNAAALRLLYPAAPIVGNFGGRLSGKSDHIVLKDPAGNPADEVRYFDSGHWPGYANGGGSSLELRDPNADNSKAEAWADSDESHKTSWQTYSYRMVANIPTGSGQPTQWSDFILGLLDTGECLIDDISVLESPTNNPIQFIANGNFENGLTGWRVLGTHNRSRVEIDPDTPGNHVLHVIATGYQEHMHNHIETTYTGGRSVANGREYQVSFRARWLAGNNFLNTRLYFNRVARTATLPMPALNGTPGARNSRYEPNIGPTFSQFQHQPVVPQAGQPVTVSVVAQDPQGVASAQVFWSVNSGAWNSAALSAAGAGRYTGTIPGQSSAAVVQFYVQATDGLGASATFPARGPDSGALFKVDDGQANLALAHNVRIILTPSNIDLLHGTAQGVNQTNVMSNDLLPCTVVYDEQRAYYDCGVHLRGSQRGRYSDTRTGFHIEFQPDDLYKGVHPVMLIDRSGAGDATANRQEEIVLKHMLNRAGGIPGTYAEICRLLAPRNVHTGPAQWFPRHEDLFIETAFNNGGDGTMFEMELIYYPTTTNQFGYKNPQPDSVIGTDFTDLGTDKEIYRYNFLIKNHRDVDDYRQFVAFCKAMSLSGTALQAQTESVLDVDQWMRAYALVSLCSVGDMYTFGNNHNWFVYTRPSDGKLLYFPWDMDFVFTRGSSGALVGDQNMGKLVNLTPNLRRMYGHMLDIIDVCFNTGYMTYWTDHYDNFAPGQNYAGSLANIGARAAYVRSTISGAGGNAPFAVSGTNDFTTSSNLIILSGTAPVQVKTITVNGVAYPITWSTISSWTLRLTVSAPSNTLNVACYDVLDRPLTNLNRSITVIYTGPMLEPAGNVVINEIMYQPAVSNAYYVELQNLSADYAFDLSHWQFRGLEYTFPPGTVLPARSFLVLAKDRAAFATAYGSSTSVFSEFDGRLDSDGETLTLLIPGATPAADVVVDEVRYEPGAPWPPLANGQGAALQLIDGSVDNARVSNWSDGTGWRYYSATGTVAATGTNFFIWMQQAGDVYIDDLMLVPGLVAGVGTNILQNGDFESPLPGTWDFTTNASGAITATNLTNSVRSTERVHSGQASLHVVSTGAGTTTKAIVQAITPPPTASPYTLSYWYYTSANGTNLTVRTFSGSGLNTVVNFRPLSTTPAASNSTVASLPPYPLLWLNEAQPNNVSGPTDRFGDHDPWIELYNSGTNALPLDGYFLANNYSNLTQWQFPTGAVIPPGQFLVVWADGEPGESDATEWHTSFALNSATGSVALVRLVEGAPQIMDYLNYAGVGLDQSYGDYPDGQPFHRRVFGTATPGAGNLVPPVTVFINEWVANNVAGPGGYPDPADGQYDDWFELYNPASEPANLSDLYLTDNLANPRQWRIPDGTVIPADGYLLVWADGDTAQNGTGTNGDLHANFKLEKNGEALGLFAVVGTNIVQVDAVTFGGQFNNISEGRYPDGAGQLEYMPTPTPRAPNLPGNSLPVLAPISNLTASAGQLIRFTVVASDPDAPPQLLTFALEGTPPTGATIEAATGLFEWTPTIDQAPGTYLLTVRVSDNGIPILSARRTFSVTVLASPHVVIQPPVNGEVSMTFGTQPGKHYRVEYKDDLGEPAWVTLQDNLLATGSSLTVTDLVGDRPQRFYQIVLLD